MSKTTRHLIITTILCSLFVTGCHKPTFDHLEPTTEKWSLTVLAQTGNDQEKAAVESLTAQLAQDKKNTAFQVKWVKPEEASNLFQQTADQSMADLVVLAADSQGANEIALKHPDKRFTFLGGQGVMAGENVRHVTHDPNKKWFLAGLIAAEANKTSREPFSVLVDKPLLPTDEAWKMIVAGARYAGRTDMPVQVHSGQTELSGKAMILLTELGEETGKRAKQERVALIRTDERYADIPLQANVIAEPATLLSGALADEVQAVTTGKWQGEQINLSVKRTYDLHQSAVLSDRGLVEDLAGRLEFIEAGLTTGSIKPESIFADEIQ